MHVLLSMKKQYYILSLFISGCLLLCTSSCDNYQKILKSTNHELKYKKVKEYYNAGQCTKAIPLFEDLMGVYRGSKEAEKLYYFYAYCQYSDANYLMSAYYFQNFTEIYPNSAYTEDAMYMVGYSHYQMSPNISLEQTETEKAIETLQTFINTYPQRDKVASCNILIDELRLKLEEKAFMSANLYHKIGNYQAAITSFKNVLRDFPDTKRKEQISFNILESEYDLAKKSVETKQADRYSQVIKTYTNFIERFPQSTYIKDAERIFSLATNALKKITAN